MRKVMKYADSFKRDIYGALVLIMLSVIAGIIPYFIVNNIVVSFIADENITTKYIISLSIMVVLFLILKTILHGVGITLSHKGAYGILYGMRNSFAKKMTVQPLGKILDNGTGLYKKKFVEDIGSLEVILAHIIPEGIPNLVIPLFVYIIIFITDWRMGLLSLASVPFGIIPMSIMMKEGMKKMPIYYKASDRLNSTIIEYISGMEVIKIFGQTTDSYEKYVDSVDYYKEYSLDWVKVSWKHMAVVGIVLPCTIILTLPIGTLMYMNGVLSLQSLIFTLLLDLSIGIPLNKALLFMPYIPQLGYAVNELEKVFDDEEIVTGTIVTKPNNYDIDYDNITFAYKEKNVINNLSFTAKQNTLTAIVGPSGGGKSTIAKLLVHYWDVSEGSISIGGRNIKEYSMDTLMEMISYVSQDNFLFNVSIMENIRIGKLDASDEEVINAAKAASCHEFITNLPDSYNTVVGTGGGKLSGGEKQRITIARAILKNAPIVILDEATAYADAENEDLIQEAINNLMSNKTIIVIAHRLRSISDADNILVMDNGHLVDSGKHEELLQNSTIYKKLWEANEKSINWNLEV